MALAEIEWIKYENGGKKIVPPINNKYYSLIKFENHKEPLPLNWSFVVTNIEFINERKTISELSFLSNEAPHHLLKSENSFFSF